MKYEAYQIYLDIYVSNLRQHAFEIYHLFYWDIDLDIYHKWRWCIWATLLDLESLDPIIIIEFYLEGLMKIIQRQFFLFLDKNICCDPTLELSQ